MTSIGKVAVVGAGQAGSQVAVSLREQGFEGEIEIFGEEAWLPYQRPPLSKTYLKEEADPDKVYFRPQRFYDDKKISIRTGARVASIDRAAHTLTLDSGEVRSWDRLVLTTGVTNRRLTVPSADLAGVVTLRGLDDAHQIRTLLRSTRRLAIVGGGVIGLEMSGLARSLGIDVDIFELGDRLAARVGSAALSAYFLHFHRGLGANVHLSTTVSAIDGADGKVTGVVLGDGSRVPADQVLVSIGVVPNTALAQAAGLDVEDGILVDRHMRTSDQSIYAAGDCTRFAPPFGCPESLRLESVQNAIDQARTIADNILGRDKPYEALPWFWSDQGTLKLQIAGCTIGHDKTVAKTDPSSGAMTVYCFAGDDLIGVECINRPADFVSARRILGARKKVTPGDVERPDFDIRAMAR
ncbi:MAG: NAD(P)/FAD-dependent oxidoreductase [Hyphomicrobiaceae bacterium]